LARRPPGSDPLPKVYYNLLSNSIHVPDSWFMTLFVEQLNLSLASRVWDQLLLEGDGFIFRTCPSSCRADAERAGRS
jgi:hypothetical protein